MTVVTHAEVLSLRVGFLWVSLGDGDVPSGSGFGLSLWASIEGWPVTIGVGEVAGAG